MDQRIWQLMKRFYLIQVNNFMTTINWHYWFLINLTIKWSCLCVKYIVQWSIFGQYIYPPWISMYLKFPSIFAHFIRSKREEHIHVAVYIYSRLLAMERFLTTFFVPLGPRRKPMPVLVRTFLRRLSN